MKNFIPIIFLNLIFLFSMSELYGQKLIRINSYYIEDGNGVRQKISREEAQKLMYTFQDSKKHYKNYKNLMITTATSTVVSFTFLGYYALNGMLSEVKYNINNVISSSEKEKEKVSTTPLAIGGGLLAIGILTGISSYSNLTKAIDTYNEKSGFQKNEKHLLKISVTPGSVGMVYSF
ncbi:MAG: hypothetical protein IPN79_14315 [Saprospiraceae bacterium]|nr:hypothetical protein [Saprospiraceae bacterium]